MSTCGVCGQQLLPGMGHACSTVTTGAGFRGPVTAPPRTPPPKTWCEIERRARSLGLHVSRDEYEREVVACVDADGPRYARVIALKCEGVDHEALLCAMVDAAVEEMGRRGR